METLKIINIKTDEGFAKAIDLLSIENLAIEFPNNTKDELDILKGYLKLELLTFVIVDKLKKANSEFKATDEYFNVVQEIRRISLLKYEGKSVLEEFINADKVDEILNYFLPKMKTFESEPKKAKSTYNYHPEITDKNFNNGIGKVISAYSGKSIETINDEIAELRSKNSELSLHEATRQYLTSLEQRTDKPFVSIDIETANPLDRSLSYDGGQLTYIIETAAIKVHPDGRTEKLEFLSGIPVKFNKQFGTGFVETHNIGYDIIKDELEFVENQVIQEDLLNFISDSVVIAHNAYFERKQLTNSLKGFRKKLNEGSIEMLDTMNFCKYLVPEADRNTNEAFVIAAGLDYKNGHRALQDAKMTLEAFTILKNNRH